MTSQAPGGRGKTDLNNDRTQSGTPVYPEQGDLKPMHPFPQYTVTRKRAQLQKDKEETEEIKNMHDAEPKIKEDEETKGLKEENLRADVQPSSAPNGNGTAAGNVDTAAPSGAPPAMKLEPPPGVYAGPRPMLPPPGLPLVRPPFNPALAGGPHPPRPALPGAPGSAMPMTLPPGLAPALRGASPAQIAEMIAAARQIQQQRLLQMHQQQLATAAGGGGGGGSSGGPSAAAGGAAGAPRPPMPLPNIPAPTGQAVRPFVVTSRPAGAPNDQAGPSNTGVAQPLPPSTQQGGLLPPQPIGSLKRKSDDLTPGGTATGVAMGFPGHLPPQGMLGHQHQQPGAAGVAAPPAAGAAPAAADPGLSEEVATSAGDHPAPGIGAAGAGPATSVSAHFTYGNSGELYGDEDGSGGSGAGLDADGKKVRLVWTQELHNRFINALSHLGLKHAVPKNILTMMNVEGMTRENVASHLQKYRLYLKKIGGHSEKDRVDADVLQALHEQNVQHMAAQQVMQQSMAAVTGAGAGHHHHHLGGGFMGGVHHAPQHQYTTAYGLDATNHLPDAGTAGAAAPMGAHPGVGHHDQHNLPSGGVAAGGNASGSGGHPSNHSAGPPAIYIAPGDIVEGIPVSDIPVPEPVSPTVTAALEAGGKFNPQGWQYPPLPMPDHPSSSIRPLAPPSGAVIGMPHHQTGGGGINIGAGDLHQQNHHQQQQYHQFNYHHQHHSTLGDLTAAAGAGEAHHQSHEEHVGPSPAVWTDNGEGWAEGWPCHGYQDYVDPQDNDGNRILIKTGGGGGEDGEGAAGDGQGGGSPGDGNGNGSGGGGCGNNNAVVDDDDDDPPLIPGVPSAGELHHMVERLPMRMADPA